MTDNNNRVAVFTFSKFDPPCAQDEDLVKAMVTTKEMIKRETPKDVDLFVFPSRSLRNNMPLALRRHYLNLAFAEFGARVVDAEKAIDPFKSLDYLVTDLGYKHVVAVFWDETAAKLKDLAKYTADAEIFHIASVDATTVDGSRSVGALLSAASTSDLDKFRKASPASLTRERDYYAAVRNMLTSLK